MREHEEHRPDHKHDHKHAHSHASASRRRLKFVLGLTVVYMLAEAVGGYLTNSLALLSDAGHMLADVAALLLAMLALWFASRPVTTSKTYGYYRLEILAALANGVALVVISLLIFYEAFERIQTPKRPDEILGFEVIWIAAGGLVINIISAWLLHSASEENLNVRAAFLHVLGDALGSVGAIAAGVIIWRWGWTLADPIISVVMSLLIIYSSWHLIRESVNILLEGTPSHINVRAVIAAMHEVAGVTDVHDLHVWTISSGKDALSAHVTLTPGARHRETLVALQERLQHDFNIGHVTIQLEMLDEANAENVKLYQILRKS
ncbi:MAG TPA: cation diffusion facilitator family transporter [Blastocatellia bacterium]|nr:cation diffusion facilitator family transporter [Blastocatellia bacterium]